MKVLLLAGTNEARLLAPELLARGFDVTASLVGSTRAPRSLGCKTRFGGFGGDKGFMSWLDTSKTNIVIDATHPFAFKITERTQRLCIEKKIPYMFILRNEWIPKEIVNCTSVKTYREAISKISPGSRVFLATGRQSLDEFSLLTDSYIFCRLIDKPTENFPFQNGEYVVGRPPFSVTDEVNLFKKLEVDILVLKNSGGDSSKAKLRAANILKIPIIMLVRPDYSGINSVNSIYQCLEWVSEIDKNRK